MGRGGEHGPRRRVELTKYVFVDISDFCLFGLKRIMYRNIFSEGSRGHPSGVLDSEQGFDLSACRSLESKNYNLSGSKSNFSTFGLLIR